MPERNLDTHLSQWTVQAITRLWCTFAVIQGVLILVGGSDRWSAPSFQTAMLVPGAPAVWGWALFLLGTVGLLGTFRKPRYKVVFYMMLGITTWLVFFAGSLFITAINNPNAATTGVTTYVTMAVTSAVVGSVYRVSRKG